jgi:thiamine biosynthesis protein ThiI
MPRTSVRGASRKPQSARRKMQASIRKAQDASRNAQVAGRKLLGPEPMGSPMGTILVRYGELALKSRPVRLRFERTLIRNIEDLFIHAKQECLVERQWGRILLFAKDDAKAKTILGRVFGVTSFSPANECGSDAAEISKVVAERSLGVLKPSQSFAIRARRTGSHTYSSQTLAAQVGSAVMNANADRKIRVDLTSPDTEFFVEVRQKKAYNFLEKFPGPGGLPMGTQGRVVALLDGEHSASAAWMMMKRGCRVIAVGSGDGAKTAMAMLLPWVPGLTLHEIDDISIDGLTKFARRKKAEAIVLGTTYKELDKGIPTAAIPVLFPLCGMGSADIAALVARIRDTHDAV